MMTYLLPVFAALVAVASLSITRKASTIEGFYSGRSSSGAPPSLLTLVLSQTTTWIFARSLLNAAILGFYYGIWGTLAYATYYLSFLTGAVIVDQVRFRYGHESIQAFLNERFGRLGPACYNIVIALRLTSEVFANLLVIGILFGVEGSTAYTLTIVAFSVVTLVYAMLGGLNASLRTDVFQMSLFLVTLVTLMLITGANGLLSAANLNATPFDITDPGPVLIIVALLQVWSYPMHDPVMMDRGFLADRNTTRRSFLHACWLSVLCIIAFGLLGVIAGANATDGETMNAVLERLLGIWPMFLFNAALIVSAMSTLDSTLSSAAKLVVVDMRWLSYSMDQGRLVMAVFMLAGLGMVFLGNNDLFSAVAVSGTAALYLFPVIVFSLLADQRRIALWSYLVSFGAAMVGAVLYFVETTAAEPLLGNAHKYTKLLWISSAVMIIGCVAFQIGNHTNRHEG